MLILTSARIAGLNIKGDRLAGQSFHKDLHAAAQAEHQVERGLLLNVVVRKGAAILELLAGEDETLLIWRNSWHTHKLLMWLCT